jgi:hypothetical protein
MHHRRDGGDTAFLGFGLCGDADDHGVMHFIMVAAVSRSLSGGPSSGSGATRLCAVRNRCRAAIPVARPAALVPP